VGEGVSEALCGCGKWGLEEDSEVWGSLAGVVRGRREGGEGRFE
jgi:hypothetical protein